jgi:uncharacterized membrane protein (UPF0127 family)
MKKEATGVMAFNHRPVHITWISQDGSITGEQVVTYEPISKETRAAQAPGKQAKRRRKSKHPRARG